MDIGTWIVALYLFALRYPYTMVTLAFLSIATYYDIREREIDTKLYIAVIPPGLIACTMAYMARTFSLYEVLANTVVTAVVAASTYVLARRGMMGFGDVFLVAIVGLLNPGLVRVWNVYAAPLMLTVVLGSVYVLFILASNLVHNLRRMEMFRKATGGLSRGESFFYLLVGKVMTADEFRRSKFYFPLIAGGTKRMIARVGVEPLEGSEHYVEGEYVVATYGFPFAAVLLVGYVLVVSMMFYGFVGGLMRGCGFGSE